MPKNDSQISEDEDENRRERSQSSALRKSRSPTDNGAVSKNPLVMLQATSINRYKNTDETPRSPAKQDFRNKEGTPSLGSNKNTDVSDDEDSGNDSSNYDGESKKDSSAPDQQLQPRSSLGLSGLIEARRSIHENPKTKTVESSSKVLERLLGYWKSLIGLLVVIVGVVIGIHLYTSNKSPTTELNFKTSHAFLKEMKQKYPSQDQREFEVFAEEVERANRSLSGSSATVVVLLIHHGDEPRTATAIGTDMAEFAAGVFHRTSEVYRLQESEMNHKYLKENWDIVKNRVSRTGSLLVTNLEKLDSETAKLFHSICDKYSPFIKNKAAYVLVLKTSDAKLLEYGTKKLRECAMSTIGSLWGDLGAEILQPLSVRLVDHVIKIYPE